MITLKSSREIELMRRAGKITAAARALARDMVKPGVTTHQIDKAVFRFLMMNFADNGSIEFAFAKVYQHTFPNGNTIAKIIATIGENTIYRYWKYNIDKGIHYFAL